MCPSTKLVLLQNKVHVESHGVVPDQEDKTEGNHQKVPAGLTHHDQAGHVLAHLVGKGVDPDHVPVM